MTLPVKWFPHSRDLSAAGSVPELPAGAEFLGSGQRCVPRSFWYCLTHFLVGGNHSGGEGSGSKESLGIRAGDWDRGKEFERRERKEGQV